MAEAQGNYTGPEKAAILLMSLGEQDAAEVLKLMGPKEVQKIGTVMANLSNVSRNQVGQVLGNFIQSVGEQTGMGVGNEDYIRKMFKVALGEEKASGVIDRILQGQKSKGMEALKWMDPKGVAEVIRMEHPQIIAIVLAYLDGDHAAEILSYLPDKIRPDLVMRIASLDGIQPQALQELDDIMEKQFSGQSNLKSSSVGGAKAAADILNFMDASVENEIMDNVRETNAEMGDQIQDLMFVFDNLEEVEGAGIQALLREVSTETLVLALKGASEGIKEKIFTNMSKRAGEMLRDDLETRGPVRVSEMEAAQKEILAIARRMAESGDLALGGGGEAYV